MEKRNIAHLIFDAAFIKFIKGHEANLRRCDVKLLAVIHVIFGAGDKGLSLESKAQL
jgi:hypothetical protein